MEQLQASIVSFYGAKPSPMVNLIRVIQKQLQVLLGSVFACKPLCEVHATIIGLEGVRDAAGFWNRSFFVARDERRRMDVAGLLDDVHDELAYPIQFQFAGYSAGAATSIVSRGEHPFYRSFSIQGESAVLIGWPVPEHSMRLDGLRRRAQKRNCLHKYHALETDVDDELYLVVGRLEAGSGHDVEYVRGTVRELLASLMPVSIELRTECLSVVRYTQPQLPLADTANLTIAQARAQSDWNEGNPQTEAD